MCWHKWTKWKDKGEFNVSDYCHASNTRVITDKGIIQERNCEKCNKLELRKIKYLNN